MTDGDAVAQNSGTNGHHNGVNDHATALQDFLPAKPSYRPEDIHNIVETVDRCVPCIVMEYSSPNLMSFIQPG